jgi:hypothetical protein
MSFFKSIGNALGSIGNQIGAAFKNPYVNAIGSILPQTAGFFAAGNALNSAVSRPGVAQSTQLVQQGYGPQMSLLPQIYRGGRAVGGVIRRNAGTIATGAATGAAIYAGRGGGSAGMYGPRRRTAKGISGAQLKAFKRVTGILDKLCKTPPPTKKRGSARKSTCR